MGKGQPVIFVHGWHGNLYSLHKLASLASKNYSTYLLDLPGFGKSDNPPPDWGVEGYADQICSFIKQLRLNRPHYVGYSFGGELGIYISSHFPHIIDKLVLCNSAFKRGKKISKLAKLIKMIPQEKRKIFKNFEPYLKKLYYNLLHRDSDMMKYPHLEANFKKIVTQDVTSEAKNIKNQTLILWGEQDTTTPALWGYELQKHIPRARIKVFPDLHHDLPMTHPELIWTEIKPFFSS